MESPFVWLWSVLYICRLMHYSSVITQSISQECLEFTPHSSFARMRYRVSSAWLNLWGRVTHICISKLTIIGSDKGLPPGRRQAIIWTNAGILLIGPLGANFNEILIEILTFSFKKMRFEVSSAKWWPFCLSLSGLIHCGLVMPYSTINLGQCWFSQWLVAWWHQAIAWTNVDFSTVRSSDNQLRAISWDNLAINY